MAFTFRIQILSDKNCWKPQIIGISRKTKGKTIIKIPDYEIEKIIYTSAQIRESFKKESYGQRTNWGQPKNTLHNRL